MKLKEQIAEILGRTDTLTFTLKDSTSIEITYGNMYESPKLSFDKLLRLSKLFGTTNIDVDDYAYHGCDSCDYGSDYGHDISISGITKNLGVLHALCDVRTLK